jgi:hypothetical protein
MWLWNVKLWQILEINSLFVSNRYESNLLGTQKKKSSKLGWKVQSFEEVSEWDFDTKSFRGPLGWCPLVLTRQIFFLFLHAMRIPLFASKTEQKKDGLDLITQDWNQHYIPVNLQLILDSSHFFFSKNCIPNSNSTNK